MPLALATKVLLEPGQPHLANERTGLRRHTCNSVATPCIFNRQGFDVTLLSQPALAPLLRDAVGLNQVVDKLECDQWAGRKLIWLPLLRSAARLTSSRAVGPVQQWLPTD